MKCANLRCRLADAIERWLCPCENGEVFYSNGLPCDLCRGTGIRRDRRHHGRRRSAIARRGGDRVESIDVLDRDGRPIRFAWING